MNTTSDISLISFSNPNQDARTYNFAKVCEEFETFFFGFAAINSVNIDSFPIELKSSARMYKQWIEFTKKILSQNPISKLYFAADLFSLVPAAILAKRHSGRLIYDSREIYSALGPIAGQKIKQIIISQIEKYFIKYVKEIIVSGELDADYLRGYFGHSTIYNVIMNVPPYREANKTELLRDKYNIKSKNVVIYQGAILAGRGIEKSIQAFINNNDFTLVIIGDGPQLTHFKNVYSSENIIFTGAIKYSELLNYTESADLGLALFESVSLSYNLALPNKLFEYAMSNIPVIASDLPAIRKIFEEFEFGKLLKEPFVPEDIFNAASIIINDSKRYSEILESMSRKYNFDNEQIKAKNIIIRNI